MDKLLAPRDQAYLDLLHHGLVQIRNFARGGRQELASIEAEHLHEVPTLIGEPNERRHIYYLQGTRGLFLKQLRELGDPSYIEQVSIWYCRPWQTLAQAAGWTLTAWDQDAVLPATPDPGRAR